MTLSNDQQWRLSRWPVIGIVILLFILFGIRIKLHQTDGGPFIVRQMTTSYRGADHLKELPLETCANCLSPIRPDIGVVFMNDHFEVGLSGVTTKSSGRSCFLATLPDYRAIQRNNGKVSSGIDLQAQLLLAEVGEEEQEFQERIEKAYFENDFRGQPISLSARCTTQEVTMPTGELTVSSSIPFNLSGSIGKGGDDVTISGMDGSTIVNGSTQCPGRYVFTIRRRNKKPLNTGAIGR